MRMDQYVGLNSWARKKVLRKQRVRIVGVQISPSGRVKPFDRWMTVPAARREVVGRIKGAWNPRVADLYRYTMPNGEVYEEYVQADPWSGGPCYFIALMDRHGRAVPNSLWTDDEIARA